MKTEAEIKAKMATMNIECEEYAKMVRLTDPIARPFPRAEYNYANGFRNGLRWALEN